MRNIRTLLWLYKKKKITYEVEEKFFLIGNTSKIINKSDITTLDKFRRKLIAAAIADLSSCLVASLLKQTQELHQF